MATKLQIIADSNSTYVDNSTGNITPTTVKALNTDWINSTVFAEQTSSMSVATASFAILASTASFVAGNVASASVATTASFALTASSTPNAIVTGSVSSNILTFTKGNGTSFTLTVAQSGSVVSSSYSDFSNQANSASLASNSLLLQGTGSNGFVTTGSFATTSGSLSSRVSSLEAATSSLSASIATVNSRVTVVSSSLLQVSASYIALSASYNVFSGSASTRITTNSASIASINTATASFAVLANNQTFSGKNTFNNDVTMSNVMVTGTASIAFLDVTFQSSSVIYSSGSNQFGDASNDTQTLWGTVNVISGPLVVTGSANFKETITGSISTASFTPNAFVQAYSGLSADIIVLNTGNGASTYVTINNVASASYALSASYAYTASSAVNATSASFATTASFALNAGSDFPFTGSAVITGSLQLIGGLIATGSTNISGSLIMFSYRSVIASNRGFQGLVTQSLGTSNNIISIVNSTSSNTGSIIISGSGNYISLSSLQSNTSNEEGATAGFFGTNAYVTVLPTISGSNPNYNTATDRNNRKVPGITNANVNASIILNDNRGSETTTPLSITNSSINGTSTYNLSSGSIALNQTNILGALTFTNLRTGSSGNADTITSTIIGGASGVIDYFTSGSGNAGMNDSIIFGISNRILVTGSSAAGGTATTSPRLNATSILGSNLIATGSGATANLTAMTIVGSFNEAASGLLNDARFTRFAVGTGTAVGARKTSFHVSASGLTTISDGLLLSGSFSITGSQTITGSLYGAPVSQSVSSLTASLNLRAGNFFNLTLPASANTYITASGQLPGQTINLKITQGATTGSVSLGAGIKQVSGSAYTVTAVASAVDIVTFISFDETGLYLSNVKNLV